MKNDDDSTLKEFIKQRQRDQGTHSAGLFFPKLFTINNAMQAKNYFYHYTMHFINNNFFSQNIVSFI